MGWNQLQPLRADPLLDGIAAGDYVYFVHSYAAPVTADTLAATRLRRALLRGREARAISAACSSIPSAPPAVGARLLANFIALRS